MAAQTKLRPQMRMNFMTASEHPVNAAEALLRRLKANGVDYLFANGGTDFAPVIRWARRSRLARTG